MTRTLLAIALSVAAVPAYAMEELIPQSGTYVMLQGWGCISAEDAIGFAEAKAKRLRSSVTAVMVDYVSQHGEVCFPGRGELKVVGKVASVPTPEGWEFSIIHFQTPHGGDLYSWVKDLTTLDEHRTRIGDDDI